MQTLRIGSRNVLAFLDSDSNAHLIDENIAKMEGLPKASEQPTAISVVGRGNIESSRSTYQFNLGHRANGEFFKMNCIGMESVTTKFNVYDLLVNRNEYRESLAPGQKEFILPSKICGSRVHLLIGIKNANLNPVLEKVLVSGVAVFISPFRDIYMSNKILAGLHKTFTRVNHGAKKHAVYALKKQVELLEDPGEKDDKMILERA